MSDVGPTPVATDDNTDVVIPDITVEERKLSLQDFLKAVIKFGGSDLHLQADSVPMIRVDGKPKFLDAPSPSNETMLEYISQLIREEDHWKALKDRGAVDLSYAMPDKSARFRVNVFHSRQKYAVVMRRIITKIPNFAELNLPPQIEAMADPYRGLVIVSGTTGSGKTTTLAAVIGKINRLRAERIITIEDPIEYQHENIKSLVSQVEVGVDTESYEFGLREMMRQDPDVIQIGEIRDTFSLTTALRAADTGHLVYSTVHATNASMTVERMVSLFDPSQKELQQTQLAQNLIGVCCQRLARRRGGEGRLPVVEVMTSTPLVKKYMLDGEYDKLKGCVGNREAGNQSFDQHLTELFQKQIIDVAEAKRLSTNVDALNLALRGITNSDTRLR